jgi:hypothetical protein
VHHKVHQETDRKILRIIKFDVMASNLSVRLEREIVGMVDNFRSTAAITAGRIEIGVRLDDKVRTV